MLRRIWRRLGRSVTPARARASENKPASNTARADRKVREYSIALPAGYPAARATVQLSVPPLSPRHRFDYQDHVMDASGHPTDTVLATTTGGFAVSHDLGRSWNHVFVKAREKDRFLLLKSLGDSEYLAQVEPSEAKTGKRALLDVLVVDERGDVLVANHAQGYRWYGCRSMDSSAGTLMYAEYPSNVPVDRRPPARVFRSRDRGRSWEVVFEQTGTQIRHFHFLQARPNAAREWWLASGDAPNESRIWVSKNNGDDWTDVTELPSDEIEIGGVIYPRSVFRLTDLAWDGNDIVWGSDDRLASATDHLAGARIFRSTVGPVLAPRMVGRCNWHIRSIVDLGAFHLAISQGCAYPGANPDTEKPGAFLIPKKADPAVPGVVHLFDIDTHAPRATKFTASRASRVAKDGTFFTRRARTDVFPSGQKLLRWDVTFS